MFYQQYRTASSKVPCPIGSTEPLDQSYDVLSAVPYCQLSDKKIIFLKVLLDDQYYYELLLLSLLLLLLLFNNIIDRRMILCNILQKLCTVLCSIYPIALCQYYRA